MDLFSILLNALFIYFLVRFLINLFDLYIIHRVVTEIRRDQAEELSKRVVSAYVEKNNDCFYVYNKDDHSFLAQGKDKVEIQQVLNNRFPGYAILVDNDQLKQVGLKWD